MSYRRSGPYIYCLSILLLVLVVSQFFTNPSDAQTLAFKVLVFYKWGPGGHPHDSTAPGIDAIRNMGAQNNFGVDTSEDADVFTDNNLTQYKVIIFLNTAGEVLNDSQQASMERYVRAGGNYVGIHSASWTEPAWPWYASLVGAWNSSTPPPQTTNALVEDRTHPSTSMLPLSWARTDEWYNFDVNPRGRVRVLIRADESTYSGGTMGSDHPLVWCQVDGPSRSWYTSFGHTPESYGDPLFRQHILGGIQWAAGVATLPPVLLTDEITHRAAALESVILTREPFSLAAAHNFSADRRTRISLLAVNVDLAPNEDTSVVTVEAENAQQRIFQLPVERVVNVPKAGWLTQVVVRLPDELANAGDVFVSMKLRGISSNRVLLNIR